MFGLGLKEIIEIILIIILIFGLKNLPKLFKNILESVRIVKQALRVKGGDIKK